MLRLLFWGVGEIERESFTSKERRVIYVHEPDGPSVSANITPGWLVATMLCLFALAARSLIHLQIFARTHLHAFACTYSHTFACAWGYCNFLPVVNYHKN